MKLITAIIQPHRLEKVLSELDDRQIQLKTVSSVLGCGRQKGRTEVYRGRKDTGNLLKKVRLEIAVNEEYVGATIEAIMHGAKTGKIGDGKIFIQELADCVRIRTGERGKVAIG